MRAVAVELVRSLTGLAVAFGLAVLAGVIAGHHSDSGVLLIAAVPAALLAGFVAVATAAYPPAGLLHMILGLLLAVVGFGILIGYGDWHQQRAGERVSVTVVAERCAPTGGTRCSRQYRLAVPGADGDTGWVPLRCEPDRPPVTGQTTQLYGRPDGWYSPVFTACAPAGRTGMISILVWLALAGVILIVRLVGLTTPPARMQAAYGR